MSFYWLESLVPILSFNPNFLIYLNLLMWWVRHQLRKYSHSLICYQLNIYHHVPINQKTISDRIFYHKTQLHSTPKVMELWEVPWNTCWCDIFFHQDGYGWDEYVPYSVVAYICTLYTFTSLFGIWKINEINH